MTKELYTGNGPKAKKFMDSIEKKSREGRHHYSYTVNPKDRPAHDAKRKAIRQYQEHPKLHPPSKPTGRSHYSGRTYSHE